MGRAVFFTVKRPPQEILDTDDPLKAAHLNADKVSGLRNDTHRTGLAAEAVRGRIQLVLFLDQPGRNHVIDIRGDCRHCQSQLLCNIGPLDGTAIINCFEDGRSAGCY